MRSFHFEVRPSTIDGKGLFAATPLVKRKKIGELSGEVISVRKARALAKQTKRIAIVELDDKFALVATENCVFRYINHSCRPNTYMRVIRHRVEFYALRDISPEEELTCNYGETHHDGKLKCRCGSEKCIGFL